MKQLLCDTGALIATYDRGDLHHARCVHFLTAWDGALLVPEPVLGETCDFLHNHVRNGPARDVTLLEALTDTDGDFDIVDPTPADRLRATGPARRLVSGPLGYVGGISSPWPNA